jgi:RimJ/RimL family protein N-acetyltransferase
MATSPDIRTTHLFVTPFAERHVTERYVHWLNDKQLMRFSEQRHQGHTLESCRAYWQSFLGSPNYFWAIEELPLGLGHIGTINAYVNEHNLVADVGILIGESQAQGRGYGTEAWKGVCDFLLRDLAVRKVAAGTLAGNNPMLKVMQTTGMVEEGKRYRHYLCEGQEMDLVHAAIFREDWLQRYPLPVFSPENLDNKSQPSFS